MLVTDINGDEGDAGTFFDVHRQYNDHEELNEGIDRIERFLR